MNDLDDLFGSGSPAVTSKPPIYHADITQGGIYQITNEEYHRDPCPVASVSRGVIASLVNSTAAHTKMKHPKLNPDYQQEEKTSFDIGTAAHSLFLEGIDNCEVIDAADWKTNKAKTERDEARLAGKVPLLVHQYEDVLNMAMAAHTALAESELNITSLYDEGDTEQTYIWQEGETYCRCRLDWISKDRQVIIDYKTAESASPEAFSRSIFNYAYDIQHAFYTRGVKAIDGTDPVFIFMVQETTAPYLCSFLALDPMALDIGVRKVEQGLKLWSECMKSGIWPGYPQRVCYLETPPWALTRWEQKEADNELHI